eukprot:CAMPEP_0203750988 /NCGR_PEP_ID=MMETSP0098-20131031/5137_1 /ASSEMBLY_ACC=CAM_ASM_000208 /TAXON_ID=96639 /ORGANISM=" , Strain NY0313808BC1" /LENGTH=244 /DNA_ID=CAMNT_0050640507 /DNA_START=11 /DNA_END=742 /DNA_ORIENTATION=+
MISSTLCLGALLGLGYGRNLRVLEAIDSENILPDSVETVQDYMILRLYDNINQCSVNTGYVFDSSTGQEVGYSWNIGQCQDTLNKAGAATSNPYKTSNVKDSSGSNANSILMEIQDAQYSSEPFTQSKTTLGINNVTFVNVNSNEAAVWNFNNQVSYIEGFSSKLDRKWTLTEKLELKTPFGLDGTNTLSYSRGDSTKTSDSNTSTAKVTIGSQNVEVGRCVNLVASVYSTIASYNFTIVASFN